MRPELFTGCFRCLECGTLVRDVEQQFKFTEPLMCTQTACQNKCARIPSTCGFCRESTALNVALLLPQQQLAGHRAPAAKAPRAASVATAFQALGLLPCFVTMQEPDRAARGAGSSRTAPRSGIDSYPLQNAGRAE